MGRKKDFRVSNLNLYWRRVSADFFWPILFNNPLLTIMNELDSLSHASQLENQSQAFHNEFHKQQRIQNPEKKPLNLVQDVPTRRLIK